MLSKQDKARYIANIQDETDSIMLYRALAAVETQPQLRQVYERLAVTEEKHVHFWKERLKAEGETIPPLKPGWRPRCLARLAKWFGPQFVLPTIRQMEEVDSRGYDTQPETKPTEFAAEERSHARLLKFVAGPAGMEGGAVARLEGRHRAIGGNALRAAVLGVNDGLLSNLSLVMGVAGANLSNRSIVITGFAGLLAGAFSMAMGEWISVTSSRELYQRQIEIESEEIRLAPEEEREELALIYQAKGLNEADAKNLAQRLFADHETALDTLAREELGIDPEELGGSPWEAAAMSFLLFLCGAILPVAPFLFLAGTAAVLVSLGVSAAGLFGIGAAITLMTGRGILHSGMRQLVFGLCSAGVTFGIGRLLGVTLGG